MPAWIAESFHRYKDYKEMVIMDLLNSMLGD